MDSHHSTWQFYDFWDKTYGLEETGHTYPEDHAHPIFRQLCDAGTVRRLWKKAGIYSGVNKWEIPAGTP
jgi:hypothetical protein